MMPERTKGRWSGFKGKDLRRHRRYAVKECVVRTSWLDTAGNPRMTSCRVLDVSAEGIGLEFPDCPAVNSMISFESEKHRLVGRGTVRHSRRAGSKFVVGSEFTNGLRWMLPEEADIREPISLYGPDR